MEKIHMWDIISLLGIPYPSSGQSSYYVQCPCCDENPRKRHLNTTETIADTSMSGTSEALEEDITKMLDNLDMFN